MSRALPPWLERTLRSATVAVIVGAAIWAIVPAGTWWADWPRSYYTQAWELWLWGGLVSVLIAALALLLSKGSLVRVAKAAWRRVLAWPYSRFLALTALAMALLTALASVLLFGGNPRNVDGFAQLFQARIFLAGRLWATAPDQPASFAVLQMITGPERWYAQYPPGQSLVLALGLALGAWWLLHPLIAAGMLACTASVGRWLYGEREGRLAALLLCISPFVVAIAGSEMSHVSAAALGMSAAAAATRVGGHRPVGAAALAGLALGIMAWFRPLDAVAAAAPVALIVLLSDPRPLRGLAAVAVAGVVACLPTLAFNRATGGEWLSFGYTVLWGPQHRLGFHEVPWGTPLTPLRAVGLTGLDLHRLNSYLFDAPLPVLALVATGFVLARRSVSVRDAVPVAGAAALFALLFFYWHRDVFYGPRLHYGSAPWVVLLVSRGLSLFAGHRSGERSGAVVGTVLAAVFAFGLLALAPARLAAYRNAWPMFRLHPDRDARRADIHHAVVVIPDGWGSRLIVRMWALGLPAWRASRVYAGVDACALEQAVRSAGADPAARERLDVTLDSLLALGRPGVRLGVTGDPNLRLPPPSLPAAAPLDGPGAELRLPVGSRLPEVCRAELAFDRQGFLVFAPFLYFNTAGFDGDIVWARDLRDRNGPLFERHPDRRRYRYSPAGPDGRPVFTPLDDRSAHVR